MFSELFRGRVPKKFNWGIADPGSWPYIYTPLVIVILSGGGGGASKRKQNIKGGDQLCSIAPIKNFWPLPLKSSENTRLLPTFGNFKVSPSYFVALRGFRCTLLDTGPF